MPKASDRSEPPKIRRDDSTPELRSFWKAIDAAAARAPRTYECVEVASTAGVKTKDMVS